ncbi:MAG: methyltransferase domain-containing protein [Fulvimarina manganoxydans]|nr:methyltransferase domain-containing protein [Fulvimarina manganoxydans]
MSDSTPFDPKTPIAAPEAGHEPGPGDAGTASLTTEFDEDALGEAYDAGLAAERTGDLTAAVAAYQRCLAIDPADHCGVRIRLAGLGAGETPASAGDAYVATLFDQHAEAFEDILVHQLGYGVPALLGERLPNEAGAFERVLDLGCGTGLSGEILRERSGHMTGVDLSEAMVGICYEKEVYDRLFVAEAVAFLKSGAPGEAFDLIVATDVLPYLGDLAPFFGKAAARFSSKGLLAVSTETMDEASLAGRPFAVGKAQRFHHGEAYMREALSAAGFDIELFQPITVRMQEGQPAPGHLVIARKV